MTPLEHIETSRKFIEQAVIEYAKDDLLQASEKAWGAAAHAVKAIAERRGWRHDSHRELYIVIQRLTDELVDPGIDAMFHVAGNSHKNFYEGWLDSVQVARNIETVGKFLVKLESVCTDAPT